MRVTILNAGELSSGDDYQFTQSNPGCVRVSGRRGQISTLLASTLLVSAFVGAGVAAAFTDAGVLTDANLNSYGNEGDAVAGADFLAFCPVSLDVDPDEFDPESVQAPPVDRPLERVLFPTDPMVLPTGTVQWVTTFPGEYYVVVGSGDTLEQFSLFEGPGADRIEAGEGIIIPSLSADQACGPNGFGVTYDFDSETYGVLLPETLPPELEEQLPEDVELEDFESVEEFLAYVEELGIVA